MVSTVSLFGVDEFNGYEKNYSFLEPIDMVQNIIDVRDNFSAVESYSANKKVAKRNFNTLKKITDIDASRANQRSMVCYYQSKNKNIISAFFEKKKHQWFLKEIKNSKHQKLSAPLKKVYALEESENCFYRFMDSFEKNYPKTELKLIGRETKVTGITLKKRDKIFNAIFNLSYLPLNSESKSGWYVSNINLKSTAKKRIKNAKVPLNKQGFMLKEVVPYLPNARLVSAKNGRGVVLEIKKMPKLQNFECSDHADKRFIRMVFTLDKNLNIKKTFAKAREKNKLIQFNVISKNAKIKKGNCDFLRVGIKHKLSLDLRGFPNEILKVKYRSFKNRKKSYLDLFY